jgi:hypothetical protein
MMRQSSMLVAIALSVAVSLSACADDAGLAPGELLPVLATADTVAAGAAIDVTFENPGAAAFSYGSCAFSLERRSIAGWLHVWPALGRPCSAVSIGLGPGQRHTLQIPGVPIAGEHRASFLVKESDSEAHHRVVSRTFVVVDVAASAAAEPRP